MKKKVLIIMGIIVLFLVIAGLVTSYIDSARVRNAVEPKYTLKIVTDGGNKVTYWGLGYKVVRYPAVSPNEPYKNNLGVKYGSWFMNYELEEDDMIVSDGECCKGCLCGDTIELLKNTETAWTLTEINSNGEYVYNSKAFINFHGTGKNKFAFFRSSGDADVSGDMTINEQNEIILTPKDNKIKKITCKVGEEKNLVAVLHCDNDFGTFTLQKQGTLELPNSIKDKIVKTKIVVVKTHDNKTITIKEENEINILLSVINNSKVWTGPVTTPSPSYKMNLFDSNNKRIAEILYNPGNYFSIEINNKSYELTNIDNESLNTILSK